MLELPATWPRRDESSLVEPADSTGWVWAVPRHLLTARFEEPKRSGNLLTN